MSDAVKSSEAKVSRVILTIEASERLNVWKNRVREFVPGSNPSASELISLMLETVDELPSAKTLRTARERYFDPIAAAKWGLSLIAKKSSEGASINIDEVLRAIGNGVTTDET